jgi:hypothetical protein
MFKMKDKEIYFKRGDKVRIINLNKEGIIISIAYISYESLSYNVEVCGSKVVVNVNNLEKI